ncbi:MAG: carbamate kinase [candidate division Zixibacteria bacterium]|nr:carbamate kinase [candidate division Zixibacteria bacterium]
MSKKTAVVALGGNAITHKDREDTIANQFINTEISLAGIIKLIQDDYNLVLTHGNGPQVGNAVLRVELARGQAPELPIHISVADLQGGMGFMIEQVLRNLFSRININKEVTTIVTQVMVDENDEDFKNPTKFIGQFYESEQAELLKKEFGWIMKPYPGDNRLRRVIASPKPLSIVEKKVIKSLVDDGVVVIASGGGGVPVVINQSVLKGIDAVIDKDRAASVMATDINAQLLVILTSVKKVSLNFSKPNQKQLDQITLAEAEQYQAEGHFPPGSMGPKIEAAVDFLKAGGEKVIIGSIEQVYEVIFKNAGTTIIP